MPIRSEESPDEAISQLECGHAFHSDCLDMWLVKHATCPICRKMVTNVQEVQLLGALPRAAPLRVCVEGAEREREREREPR